MEINFFQVDNDRDNNDIVIRNDGMIIARMQEGNGYNDETRESLQDAAELFQAAPDLLSQLKNMVEWLGDEWKETDEVKTSIRLIQSLDKEWEPEFGTKNEEAF